MKKILNILEGGLLIFTVLSSSVAVEERQDTANLTRREIKNIINIEMIDGICPIVSGKVNNVEEIISNNNVGELHLRRLPGCETLANNDDTIAELALENTLRLQLIPFRNLWTEVLQLGKDMKVENEKLARYGVKYDYGSDALYDSKTERQFTFVEQQNLSENYPEIKSGIEEIRSLYERRFNAAYDMDQVGSFCRRFCDDYGMGSVVQVYQFNKGHLLNDDVWASDWENIEDPVIWMLPLFTPQVATTDNFKMDSIQNFDELDDILDFYEDALTTPDQLEFCIQLYTQKAVKDFYDDEEFLKWLEEKFTFNCNLTNEKGCRNEITRLISAWREYNLNRDTIYLSEFLVSMYKFAVKGAKLDGKARVKYKVCSSMISQYLRAHGMQDLCNRTLPVFDSTKKYIDDVESITSFLLEKYMRSPTCDSCSPLLPQTMGKIADFMLHLLQKCEKLSRGYSIFSMQDWDAQHWNALRELETFLDAQPFSPQDLVINILKIQDIVANIIAKQWR